MTIVFDPAKDVENRRKHGISLKRASEFDLQRAITSIDLRENYGETRYRSIGFIGIRLYLFVYTYRENPGHIRAISLRKANLEERNDYAENY